MVHTGQLIDGRYRLEQELGAGGQGVVWSATDTRLDRMVALKRTLPEDGASDPGRIDRLRREARILARLNHPNVVTLFDVVSEGTDWWLVMEYVPARSLAHADPLKPEQAARLGAQLAGALEAVHATDILHRDIKPGNVLVTADLSAKLSDFGISRTVAGDGTLTATGGPALTPGFVSPEVARGANPTRASDVFSLGATLFAVVEGVSPYGPSDNPMAQLHNAASGRIARSHQSGPLAPVLAALTRVSPAKRPTAAEARLLLAELAGDSGQPPPTRRSPRRALLVAGVAVVVLVLGAGGWLLGPGRQGATGAPSHPTASETAVAAASGPVVGDPRTADPCALTDPNALERFGDTQRSSDYGNFNRCDVLVDLAGGVEADVKLELELPGGTPPGEVERKGALRIVREPRDGDECDRTVVLADHYLVEIAAELDGTSQVDPCGMADVATDSAVTVLSRGRIARRAASPGTSLIGVHACALINSAALATVPSLHAGHPDRGFGDWDCRWDSTTSRTSVHLIFDRNPSLSAGDGDEIHVGGHRAFVVADYDTDTCAVRVVHRTFLDDHKQSTDELLDLLVTGPGSSRQRCQLATALAAPAAAALPAL